MYTILTWPNEILTRKLELVGAVDEATKLQAKEITKVLIANAGLGLTASQIGIDKAMFAYMQGEHIKFMADPSLTYVSEEIDYKHEGCLSIPRVNVRIGRPKKITVQYLDLDNVIHTDSFEGLEARVIQHEIDHTNGITILDRVSRVTRQILLDKYYKKRLK